MRSWFKKITKRDARIASVLFAIALIILLVSLVKGFLGGSSFDDERPILLLIVIAAIIEYSMIVIAFSKDEEESEEEKSKHPDDIKAAEKALEKDRAELLAEKYEDIYPKE